MLKLFYAALLILGLAAPAAAEEVPILRIYTYDSFAAEWGPGPQLKAGFEKTCGCVVEFIATDSSIGALRRVQLEGDTSEADIVLGLDTAVAGEARATGLFAPHGIDLSGLLPPSPQDPDFVPFDFGYFAFVYDKDLVPNPPASFEELIAMPDDFKIVIEDPRSDTPGLGLVLWIKALYGDRAPEIWAGLKPHVLTVARGWSEAYSLFLEGEADMVLSYTTSPAYHAYLRERRELRRRRLRLLLCAGRSRRYSRGIGEAAARKAVSRVSHLAGGTGHHSDDQLDVRRCRYRRSLPARVQHARAARRPP